MKTVREKILFVILIIAIIGILGAASRYLSFKVTGLLNTKPDDLIENKIYLAGFFTHVLFGMLALLLGPAQFVSSLRSKLPWLHRWTGRLYVISCIIGGTSGLYIAFNATTGVIASAGFIGLALAWLYTTYMAYSSIRKRKVKDHQVWMIRSFSLTMAAVTLRIYLGFMLTVGMDFFDAYPIVAWICWIPNLLIAEYSWVRKLRIG